MTPRSLALTFALIASALTASVQLAVAQAAQVVVPSGQSVSFQDVIVEEDSATVRFRFIAPAIGQDEGDLTYEDVVADFPWLCENVAIPTLDVVGLEVSAIVISMADAAADFGQANPNVTQFFEPFRLEDGSCIVEQF